MRYKEFIEGIRMGAKDLATPSNKQYTVGFEFEVSVDDDIPGNSGYDDDELNDLYGEFSENWYANNTFDFGDWFTDRYLGNSRDLMRLINRNNIKPTYGFVPLDKAAKLLNERRKDNILAQAGILYKMLMLTLKDYKSDPVSFSTDMTKAVDIIQLYEFLIQGNTDSSEEQIKNKIEHVLERGGIETFKDHLNYYNMQLTDRFIFKELKPDDLKDNIIVYNDNKTDVIFINDLDQFTEYFEVDEDELRDITENEWSDEQTEQLSQDFESWINSRTSVAKTDKIAYVVKAIGDEFNATVKTTGSSEKYWAVIPDGTVGVDAEITSPAYNIKSGISKMHRVLNLINTDTHIYTGEPTGLHVNIGTFTPDEADNVDWLKFLMIMNADRVLTQFDRTHNTYAPDKLPQIIKSLQDNDIISYQSEIKKINSMVRTASNKYSAINLSKLNTYGIIELRAPGNAGYEKSGAFLEETILRIVRALELASDPAKYKNEYLSMLYKRYGKEKPKHNNNTLDSYYMDVFGTHFNGWGGFRFPIERAIKQRLSENPDSGFTLAVHKELVQAIKDAWNEGPLDIDVATIKMFLSQYDTDGVMANSKLIKTIVNTLRQLR